MKTYFISDVHLGSAIITNPADHEKKFIDWLNSVAKDATAIYLLGDIFDFWFEFPNNKIQTEYTNVLNTLKSIIENGVDVHFFCGNHDQWTFGYLEDYCKIHIHRKAEIVNINNTQFFLAHGHGHGLNEDNFKVKFLNYLFGNKTIQYLFRHSVPAQWAWNFGNKWSESNRRKHDKEENKFQGETREQQVIFVKNHSLVNPNVKYYIMGHRHLELNLRLATGAQMMIIGDFYSSFTYAVWDGEFLSMMNDVDEF